MPFTPVHLGPGALLKATLGRHFSFVVFGGAQVLMDIEALVGILSGAQTLHGPSHTLLGALIIGSVAALTGKPIGQLFLRLIRWETVHISWGVSILSAFIGTFSHILIDGVMHSDMSPFAPFIDENPLLHIISVDHLHLWCLAAGLVGVIIIRIKRLWQQR